ncbi:hypothetical protein [Flagellimonas meridianipacifica]|uniref:hypothetical protein n=1 Tax=Flagellimonas meridianipacifica TaxID=1080225 RepID=UPI000D05977E|nr:hypothetical protein [Allomuricauda pacifica]
MARFRFESCFGNCSNEIIVKAVHGNIPSGTQKYVRRAPLLPIAIDALCGLLKLDPQETVEIMTIIAKYIIILFGIFLIGVWLLILLKPTEAR